MFCAGHTAGDRHHWTLGTAAPVLVFVHVYSQQLELKSGPQVTAALTSAAQLNETFEIHSTYLSSVPAEEIGRHGRVAAEDRPSEPFLLDAARRGDPRGRQAPGGSTTNVALSRSSAILRGKAFPLRWAIIEPTTTAAAPKAT